MARRSRLLSAALLAFVLIMNAQCIMSQNFTASSGQAFVEYVRSLNDTGENQERVILMAEVIDTTNVTIPPFSGSGLLTSGVLSLVGSSGRDHPSLFNKAWRVAVMPQLAQNARLFLQDLLMTQSCFTLNGPWTQSTHGTFTNILQLDAALLGNRTQASNSTSSPSSQDSAQGPANSAAEPGIKPALDVEDIPKFDLVQRTTCLRTTTYTLQSEVWVFVWIDVMLESPFQELSSMREAWLNVIPLRKVVVASVSPHHVHYETMVSRIVNCRDLIVRSSTNPEDPHKLSEQAGTLGKPRLCLSAEAAGRELTAAEVTPKLPFWIVDSSSLRQKLGELAAYSARMRGQAGAPPASLMLTSNATLNMASSSSPARPMELRGILMLVGPFRHKPDSAVAALSLGNSTSPLIQLLNSTARLLVRNLVLEGLAAAPLPSADATAQPTASALPMWALGMPARDQALQSAAALGGSNSGTGQLIRPQLILNSCTLVLPQADYAALLAAALRQAAAVAAADAAGKVRDTVRDAWAQGATQTAAVLAGISVFQLEAWQLDPGAPNRTAPSLELAAYIGWGVNATQLVLVPEAPLGPDFPIPDLRASASAASEAEGGGMDRDKGVAIGVGVGVGGATLLLLAGTGMLLLWKKQQSGAAERATAVSVVLAPESKDESNRQQSTSSRSSSAPTGAGRSNDGQAGPPMALEQSQGQGLLLLTAMLNSRGQPHLALPLSHGSSGQRTEASACSRAGTAAAALEQAANTLNKLDPGKLMLKGILGKGSWGVVYKGEWKGLTVAVKTLAFTSAARGHGEDARSPMLPYNRAVSEAALCTSLLHPNIATTYKFDIKPIAAKQEPGQYLEVQHVVELGEVAAAAEEEEGGAGAQGAQAQSQAPAAAAAAPGHTPPCHSLSSPVQYQDYKLYLVQEYCHSSLSAAYQNGLFHDPATRWPFYDRLLTVLAGVASGLQFLHSKNIIHGDLKPANVMLRAEDSASCGVVAKLIDFGLSMALDPTATHVSNFSSGTPFYVAPEVLTQRQLTKASDIYSLGLIMWELYVGAVPMFRVKGEGVDPQAPLPAFPVGAPLDFQLLAYSCLVQDSKARPSAEQVASRLQAMLEIVMAPQPAQEGQRGQQSADP